MLHLKISLFKIRKRIFFNLEYYIIKYKVVEGDVKHISKIQELTSYFQNKNQISLFL